MTATARWLEAFRRAGTHSLIVWPFLAVARVVQVGAGQHAVAYDFTHAYLPAAHLVLVGRSPYPAATIAAITPKTAFIYPPLTAYLVTPFTLLPVAVAQGLATALAILAVVGTLWIVGVRDWRCYAVVFLWEPTFSAIQTANVNLLLAVGLAVVWRYRRRPVVVAVATGAMVALKPFLWPIAIWLLCTRRFKEAIASALVAACLVFGPWAGIGFADVTGYPHLMSLVAKVEGPDAYTIEALLRGVVSWRAAELVAAVAGLVALVAMARAGRADERRSFALAIALAFLLTPIVWMDYFVLLLVVLGLFAARFSGVWLIPLFFWIAPQVANGAPWQTAAALAVAAATFAIALRRHPESRESPAPSGLALPGRELATS